MEKTTKQKEVRTCENCANNWDGRACYSDRYFKNRHSQFKRCGGWIKEETTPTQEK